MNNIELTALLNLLKVPSLGPTRIRTLVQALGSPEAVLSSSTQELCQVEGINMAIVREVKNYSPNNFAEVQLSMADEYGVKIISIWDDEFPPLLKMIYDPPVVIFMKGELQEEDTDTVAIGRDEDSNYLRKTSSRRSFRELAGVGMTIVSGFAKGIDTIAHLAALEARGRTIAVLGNGLDVVYPAENRSYLSIF